MANWICRDLSYNNIGGEIRHGLPPNATYMFGYSLAYPLPSVKALIYLNVSHNGLSGPIGDVFADMPNLDKLDLSFNHLTGDLPSSFASLTNLYAPYLQNNALTGSIGFSANLPLRSLYLQSNHFSGYVPKHFKFIPNCTFRSDPELDNFMEIYCDVLVKYRSDLAKPLDEATTFLNNIETQLSDLCNSKTRSSRTISGGLVMFSISLPMNYAKLFPGKSGLGLLLV